MAVGPSLPLHIRWPARPVSRCGITRARRFVSAGVLMPEAAQELGKEGNIWSFCVHSSKDRSLFLQGRGVWSHRPPVGWLPLSLQDDATWRMRAGLCGQVGHPSVPVAVILDSRDHPARLMPDPCLCPTHSVLTGPLHTHRRGQGEVGCHPQGELSRPLGCLLPLQQGESERESEL